jgi:uncharacterized protein
MILCDTGPLVAAFNKADTDHARCVEFLTENWSRLVIPSLAVTEVCHLLADPQRRGRRMAELLTTYASLRLQAVDACVVALAERLDLHEAAALDRRDFQVVAPRHLPQGERLKLLPEN